MDSTPMQRSGNRQRAEWRTNTREILAEHLRTKLGTDIDGMLKMHGQYVAKAVATRYMCRGSFKLGDFAGSSIDGEPALIGYETTHELPNQLAASVESELFALGSTLYEIMTGSVPYAGLSDSSIKAAYQKNDFPDINHLEALGDIITRCWQRQYQNADEVLMDIQSEVLARSSPVAGSSQLF